MTGTSLSSGMMLGITVYRNDPGIVNKAMAEAGYALTAMVSVAETIVALASTVLSVLWPMSSEPFDYSVEWLKSSAFSFAWSLADLFLNPFIDKLVADQGSATQMFLNRDFITIPSGAVT